MYSFHGLSHLPEYGSWSAMRYRCCNPEVEAYKDYGGRGIAIHPSWLTNFKQFYQDVGPRPTPKHTLERIDNNGNYEPGNVIWASRKEQATNRRSTRLLTLDGHTKPTKEWCRVFNIGESTFRTRLKYGWSIEEALTIKPDLGNRYKRKNL